ncbi:hypothetical protein TNCT_268541 [Trichonephila clavata]|uniref:Uncharacterized protein n=1 Tax=Trichonephila clavata TaxID=2740835 RepID=A0A8X6KIZ9_TRICU|nr:hypothetical protein TNCT_268541 [Trichonephila clavata]
MGDNMEPCSKNVEETVERGYKKRIMEGKPNTGVLSNESHPTGDMSEAPRLLPRASLKRKTPRGHRQTEKLQEEI